MENAIIVDNLSKRYKIGLKHESYATLRDSINKIFMSKFRHIGELLHGKVKDSAGDDDLWALRNVSFEIKRGEIVGFIGHNGAGKSTLLKILSRITEPTAGFAEIQGRVGSLLEVGTGFHNELTGRENIFLNGSILGMRRSEIKRNFDEIVAFAEVEKFIDTPVKHYSSGMYLRLAFSVAAHLQPEVLIVDEVLAVGDARFQRKCLGKMESVSKQGRTVLFVSHNMDAITRLCDRTILLNNGTVEGDGPPHKITGQYLNSSFGTMAIREWNNAMNAPAGEVVRLRAARVRRHDGHFTDSIDIRQSVSIEMEFEVIQPGRILLPHFVLYNEEGVKIFTTIDQDSTWRKRKRPEGVYISTVRIPGNLLSEGTVFVHPCLWTLNPNEFQFAAPNAVAFQVIDSLDGDSARGDWSGGVGGVVRPLLEWSTEYRPIS